MFYPAGFSIRTLADAEYFLTHVLRDSIDVPDADNKTIYHSFCVNKATGKIALGTAKYGNDPFLSEIPVCDDRDLIRRTFKIRKSLNKMLR